MTKQIRTRYLEIAYEDAGPTDGTPIVLVHGWPGQQQPGRTKHL